MYGEFLKLKYKHKNANEQLDKESETLSMIEEKGYKKKA